MSEAQSQSPIPSSSLKYAPNRACEHCRALKVRCIPVDPSLSGSCERCFKAGSECIHVVRTRRKPRSRNDAKIMQLETEVRALSSMVRYQQQQTRHDSLDSSSGQIQAVEHKSTTHTTTAPMSPDHTGTSPSQSVSSCSSSNLDTDIIGRGLLSESTAQMYLTQFVTHLLPNHPYLDPAYLILDDMRLSRPLLFLATVAAGSSVFDPDKCRELYRELTTVLMEKIVIKGLKTLDMLQALLIAISWHYPPDGYDAVKYVQYVHLMSGIVSELRVYRKDPAPESFISDQTPDRRPSTSREHSSTSTLSKNENLDRQRALLGSYGVCARVCCGFHLPTPIPFAKWVQDCIDQLEASINGIESDKPLIALVKLARIMDESVSSLGLDDVSTPVDITVPRHQMILKGCERQLCAWRQTLTSTPLPSMEILYHGNKAYLHEVSLYIDHDPEDFRPPYTLERPKRNHDETPDLTPGHVDATFVCLSASQAALDVFLQTDLETLRTCPDWAFTTVAYSMILLVKLYMSVNETTSPFTRLIDHQTLKLPYYIDNVINHLIDAGIDGKCRMASKFTTILDNIRKWLIKQYGPMHPEQQSGNEKDICVETVSPIAYDQLLFTDISGTEKLLEFPETIGAGDSLQDALHDFDCSIPMHDANFTMDMDWDVDENVLALFQEARPFNPSLLTDSRD